MVRYERSSLPKSLQDFTPPSRKKRDPISKELCEYVLRLRTEVGLTFAQIGELTNLGVSGVQYALGKVRTDPAQTQTREEAEEAGEAGEAAEAEETSHQTRRPRRSRMTGARVWYHPKGNLMLSIPSSIANMATPRGAPPSSAMVAVRNSPSGSSATPFVPSNLFNLYNIEMHRLLGNAGLSKKGCKDELMTRLFRHQQGLKPLKEPTGTRRITQYHNRSLENLKDDLATKIRRLVDKRPDSEMSKLLTLVQSGINVHSFGKDFLVALSVEWDFPGLPSPETGEVMLDWKRIYPRVLDALREFESEEAAPIVFPTTNDYSAPDDNREQSMGRAGTPDFSASEPELETPRASVSPPAVGPTLSATLSQANGTPHGSSDIDMLTATAQTRDDLAAIKRTEASADRDETGASASRASSSLKHGLKRSHDSASETPPMHDGLPAASEANGFSNKRQRTLNAGEGGDLSAAEFLRNFGYDDPRIIFSCEQNSVNLTFPLALMASKSPVVQKYAEAAKKDGTWDKLIHLRHARARVEDVARLFQFLQAGTVNFSADTPGKTLLPTNILNRMLCFGWLVHKYEITGGHEYWLSSVSSLLKMHPEALTPKALRQSQGPGCFLDSSSCTVADFLLRFAANRSLAGHGFLEERKSLPGFSQIVAEVSIVALPKVEVDKEGRRCWTDDAIGHSFST